jgi:outer membrane lipoprotein-sorting protein
MSKVFTGLFALLLAHLFATTTHAQTVDEIIQKNIAARGGAEKIKSVKSLRMTCKIHVENMEIPGEVVIKRPGMARGEANLQGMKLIKSYDGQTGWEIDMFEGKPDPEKMTDDDEKDMKHLADIDGPLLDYKAKGNAVELVGKEELESTPVYRLKVTDKTGDVQELYIDCKSFLELKMSSKRHQDGRQVVSDEYYSDYKPVNGLMMAHSIESRTDGEAEDTIVIDKIEMNVDIDDSIFKMPKKADSKPAPEKKPLAP